MGLKMQCCWEWHWKLGHHWTQHQSLGQWEWYRQSRVWLSQKQGGLNQKESGLEPKMQRRC